LWEDYELTYHNAAALLPGGKAAAAPDAPDAPDGGDQDDDAEYDEAQESSRLLSPPLIGEAAAKRSAKLRDEMRSLGHVNVLSIDDFAQTNARYDKMSEQSRDLEEAGDKLRQIISDMSEIMSRNFEEQFELINKNFDITFKELFSGGRARLLLSEGKSILEAGIEIEIQLPGKRMQNMMLYSGGERALTAIALIFAMLTLRPAPFCMLDEIESTLDEANVDRFSNYIKKYSEGIQFLMVTHRKGTMEGSNALYGVSMRERGVSGVVSIRLSDAS
jgi:chromosome segregation protein